MGPNEPVNQKEQERIIREACGMTDQNTPAMGAIEKLIEAMLARGQHDPKGNPVFFEGISVDAARAELEYMRAALRSAQEPCANHAQIVEEFNEQLAAKDAELVTLQNKMAARDKGAELQIERFRAEIERLRKIEKAAREYAGYDTKLFLTTSSPEDGNWFKSSMATAHRNLKAALKDNANG